MRVRAAVRRRASAPSVRGRGKPSIEPADQPPVGNQMFAVTSAAAVTRWRSLKSLGLRAASLTAFHLCPLMRIRETFRYFWPSREDEVRMTANNVLHSCSPGTKCAIQIAAPAFEPRLEA